MSSDEARYRLKPRALDDLDTVWRYSAETWSVQQANDYLDDLVRVFQTLAAFPTLARERAEFDPPVRIHTHESHLVVYVIVGAHFEIVRILGGRQNWLSILKATDPH